MQTITEIQLEARQEYQPPKLEQHERFIQVTGVSLPLGTSVSPFENVDSSFPNLDGF